MFQLGDDPTECQALKMAVRPKLLKMWTFYCKQGLKKDEYDALSKKYVIAIMSAIYESRNEGLDLESLLVYLADASKIVTAIIHK